MGTRITVVLFAKVPKLEKRLTVATPALIMSLAQD
jgi:hypothetical protein